MWRGWVKHLCLGLVLFGANGLKLEQSLSQAKKLVAHTSHHRASPDCLQSPCPVHSTEDLLESSTFLQKADLESDTPRQDKEKGHTATKDENQKGTEPTADSEQELTDEEDTASSLPPVAEINAPSPVSTQTEASTAATLTAEHISHEGHQKEEEAQLVEKDMVKVGPGHGILEAGEVGAKGEEGMNPEEKHEKAAQHSDFEYQGHAIAHQVMFLFFILFGAAALETLLEYLPKSLKLPSSVANFFFGFICSVSRKHLEFMIPESLSVEMKDAQHVHPFVIMMVILPILLYGSASHLNFHVFKQVLASSLLLAFAGVMVQMGMLGAFLYYVAGMRLWVAVMLASILSATDPVAVVAALHTLHAPAKLASLIEGESLLNDGSAAIFFFVARALARTCYVEMGVGETSLFLLQLALGGPLLGLIFGWLVGVWLSLFKSGSTLEVCITLVGAWGLFWLAEAVKVSEVLAVVTYGLYFSARGKLQLSREVQKLHDHTVTVLEYVGNQAIFIYAGFASGYIFHQNLLERKDGEGVRWVVCGLLFLAVQAARLLMLLFFWPLLRRMGYGLSTKEMLLLWFGGLRGAVGLALALLILNDVGCFADDDRYDVTFYVVWVTALLLITNGCSMEAFYKWLNPYPASKERRGYLESLLKGVEAEYAERRVALEDHWLLGAPTIKKARPTRGSWFMHRKHGGDHGEEETAETGQLHVSLLELADMAVPSYEDATVDENLHIHAHCRSLTEALGFVGPVNLPREETRTKSGPKAVASVLYGAFVTEGSKWGCASAILTKLAERQSDAASSSDSPASAGAYPSLGDMKTDRTTAAKALSEKQVETIRRETDSALVFFNAAKTSYQTIYSKSCIEAESVLNLSRSIDKAIDGVTSASKAEIRKNRKSQASPASFAKEAGAGEGAQGLRAFENELEVLRHYLPLLRHDLDSFTNMVPLVTMKTKLQFDIVLTHIECLFAYELVHEQLFNFADSAQLWPLFHSGSRESLASRLVEARADLRTIQEKAPKLFAKASFVIALRVLLNLKKQIVNEHIETGLLPEDDGNKFIECVEESLKSSCTFGLWSSD